MLRQVPTASGRLQDEDPLPSINLVAIRALPPFTTTVISVRPGLLEYMYLHASSAGWELLPLG